MQNGKVEFEGTSLAGGRVRGPNRAMSPAARRPARHTDPAEDQSGPRPLPSSTPNLADVAGIANISDETRTRGGSVSPSMLFGSAMNPFSLASTVEPVTEVPVATLQRYVTSPDDVRAFCKGIEEVAIKRFKITLVGAGEAGKTSLKKCFANTPLFFKNLPEVGTTTGIDVAWHRQRVMNDSLIDLEVMDFAGQEVYHSHSLFLSNRTLFLFVWNMAALEQTFDEYGISEAEEARLRQWADIVQAKCPGAAVVVVGTHKDMLRDPNPRTVVLILRKVCRAIVEYIDTFKPPEKTKNIFVHGSFCVSCKDRTAIPENQGGPERIKDLFQWLADLCNVYCRTDPQFPHGTVPRKVMYLIATLHKLKQEMETVLLPMKDFNALTRQLGIPKEMLHPLTVLLHDWDILYLFDRQASRLGRQDCVFLHPQWLAQMVSTVFTYAHACTAPEHERATMVGMLIDSKACDDADPTRLILEGVLSNELAMVMFARVLKQLKREPTQKNIDICTAMLMNLDVIYKNTYCEEEGPYLAAAKGKPTASQQYYIPSIFPRSTPPQLALHISRLLRLRGIRKSYRLVPFPKELLHMLHCRVHPLLMRLYVTAPAPGDPPSRKIRNNWNNGFWLAGGGGGQGRDVGIGPLRAFVQADLTARRIDMWAIQPPNHDEGTMTAQELCAAFVDGLTELCYKYPGVAVTEIEGEEEEEKTTELEDDTLNDLIATLKPGEVRWLIAELGFKLTEAQEENLNKLSTEASSPDQYRISLFLDRLVKALMMLDPALSKVLGSESNGYNPHEFPAETREAASPTKPSFR